MNGFPDFFPLQIRYEGKSYSLQSLNMTPLRYLRRTLFVSFHQGHPTDVNTHDLHDVKYIYVPETGIVALHEQNDAVLYAPEKNATVILKGAYSPGSDLLKRMTLKTPFLHQMLESDGCDGLDSIDAFEGDATQQFLGKYKFQSLGNLQGRTFDIRTAHQPSTIYLLTHLFCHDIHQGHNGTLDLHLKGSQGEQGLISFDGWEDIPAEHRPLLIQNDQILDMRGMHTADPVQTGSDDMDMVPIFIPSHAAHELDILHDQGSFYIIRQTIESSNDRLVRRVKRYTLKPEETKKIFFYHRTLTHHDAYQNQTLTYYVLDPQRLPLQVHLPHFDALFPEVNYATYTSSVSLLKIIWRQPEALIPLILSQAVGFIFTKVGPDG